MDSTSTMGAGGNLSPHAQACTVDAKQSSPEAIVAIIKKWGAVKLEHCFEVGDIEHIVAEASRIYAEWNAAAANSALPPQVQSRRRIPLDKIAVDGTTAEALLQKPMFFDIARLYFRKEPRPQPDSCFVRELVPGPKAQPLPFHQDQTVLRSPLLNVWVPLTPCGIDAPALELAIATVREVLEVAGLPDAQFLVDRARIDEALVLKTYGAEALWAPECIPGDAILFTGTTVHRTYLTPSMTKRRLSAEVRLAVPRLVYGPMNRRSPT